MIKYDKHTSQKTGITKTQVRVTTEVKQPNGKHSKITVKSFGYLEDHIDDKEQYIEAIKKFDIEYHQGKKLFLDLENKSCFDKSNSSFNFGYKFLETIYDELEIDEFLKDQKNKTTFELSSVFKYDVLMRILSPGSKRSTYQLKDCLYGTNNFFRLHQNYRSLTYYSKWQDGLIRHLNNIVKEKIGRENEYALYDCTNYYCETDFADVDGLRKKGISKEHRTEPIIQMGLFIDSNALPVSFSMFPGNTADTYTIREVMNGINENYGFKHIIIVGDKGFNSRENMTRIVNDGNGFVFSTKLRGQGKTKPVYQDKCFDTSNWIGDEQFKYTLFDDKIELSGLNKADKKLPIKVLIYYKKEIADLEKVRRQEKINKANEYIQNNPGILKMNATKTHNPYVTSAKIVSDTGEVADKEKLSLNKDKIELEEKLDGFFCIITSEIAFDKEKILGTYGQLWMIEESFRITKSDLDERPIFVYTEPHIKGYFVESFVALLIIRLLQHKMGDKRISAQRIIEALNNCNCNQITKDIVHIERIGGRNAFFYKKMGESNEKKSTLKTISEIVESDQEKDESIPKECADQIQEDFIKIVETYKIKEPMMWMRQKEFDAYLKSINFSTILDKIKKKPGRPRKA